MDAPLTAIHFGTVRSPQDVHEILALQAENLASALTAETLADQGFVTVRHDPEVLLRMNEQAPAVVARAGERVVGYALVMPQTFAAEVPVLGPMFALLETLSWKGAPLAGNSRWFVMGQICVARPDRGLGIVEGLYRGLAEHYGDRFDFTVTEVAERNPRSLRAHARVGFETMRVYTDEASGERWHVIALGLAGPRDPAGATGDGSRGTRAANTRTSTGTRR